MIYAAQTKNWKTKHIYKLHSLRLVDCERNLLPLNGISYTILWVFTTKREMWHWNLCLWLGLSVFSCYITIVLKWFQTPDWIFFAHWLFMCCSQVKTSINSNWCTIFCINDVCNVDWIILCLYNLIEYNNLLIFEESHRIFNHQRAAVIWSVLILLRNASFFLPSSAKPWCDWIRQAGGKKQKRFLS